MGGEGRMSWRAPTEGEWGWLGSKRAQVANEQGLMPVPRCDTCRHRDRDGVCTLVRWTLGGSAPMSVPETLMVVTHPNMARTTAALYTAPDFGCVQWEAKDA